MTQPLAMPSLVDHDLYCVACDYNLRMQPGDGACPECGMPVVKTIQFPRLSRSAPRWLTSLLDSVTILLIAFVIDLIAYVLMSPFDSSPIICVGAVPWGLTWFAIWLLTRPEPGRLQLADRLRAWTLRLLATGPYIVFVAISFTVVRNPAIIFGLLLCGAPAGFLYYDHLRRSALRLPAPRLAMQASLLRFVVPLASVAVVLDMWIHPRTRGGIGTGMLLHTLPRPAIGGAASVGFIWQIIISRSDLIDLNVAIDLFVALSIIATIAVLVQFRLAFARAVRSANAARGDVPNPRLQGAP